MLRVPMLKHNKMPSFSERMNFALDMGWTRWRSQPWVSNNTHTYQVLEGWPWLQSLLRPKPMKSAFRPSSHRSNGAATWTSNLLQKVSNWTLMLSTSWTSRAGMTSGWSNNIATGLLIASTPPRKTTRHPRSSERLASSPRTNLWPK